MYVYFLKRSRVSITIYHIVYGLLLFRQLIDDRKLFFTLLLNINEIF